MSHTGTWVAGLCGLTLLTACAEPEVVLPGPREPVRAEIDETAGFRLIADGVNEARAISLAPQQNNANWTHRPGSETFRVANAALGRSVQQVWQAGIGAGDKKRQRILADPVVADGRVFTMDSDSVVYATATSGAPVWQRNLTPDRDRSGEAAGGQFAYANGVLYVTSGYGTLTAIEPSSGETIWQQKLGAAGTGAPVVSGGLVYLVAGDSTAWALEADTGRIRWQLDGLSDFENVQGGPAPALTGNLVVFAYGSGEVQAAFREGGLRLWNSAIVGQRRGQAPATVNDITGDPVVSGDRVYIGTHAGRLVSMDVNSGERVWTQQMGALAPVWPAGDSIFAVNDLNQLVRLEAGDGSVVWTQNLPGFVKRRRTTRRAAIHAHHGPVMAGGQLYVASGDGFVRAFDPVSGEMTQKLDVPGGATSAPVVAGGTLYVVSSNGVLHAFR